MVWPCIIPRGLQLAMLNKHAAYSMCRDDFVLQHGGRADSTRLLNGCAHPCLTCGSTLRAEVDESSKTWRHRCTRVEICSLRCAALQLIETPGECSPRLASTASPGPEPARSLRTPATVGIASAGPTARRTTIAASMPTSSVSNTPSSKPRHANASCQAERGGEVHHIWSVLACATRTKGCHAPALIARWTMLLQNRL